MLEKVEIRTKQGTLFTLPLLGESNGYLVEDIENLDPVKANYVSTSSAQIDGEIKQAVKREKRNILLHLELDLDFLNVSVSDRRNYLYQIFIPKTELHFRFIETGGRLTDIYGEVESIQAPRFTKDPKATISILCFNPDFYIPTPVVVNGSTVSNQTEFVHNYPGTVETGFIFQLNVNRLLNDFTIYHKAPDGVMNSLDYIDVVGLQAGDILRISTVPGSKYIHRVRAGVETSVLYNMDPLSTWIRLYPGSNSLRVYAEGALIPYSITYTTKIGGL